MLFKKRIPVLCVVGFTVIELVLVMIIVAILGAFLVPRFGNLGENAKSTATKAEMNELISAIAGTGDTQFSGYLSQMNTVPSALIDLITDPGTVSLNPVTSTGWYGPYVDTAQTDFDGDGVLENDEYNMLRDAWGVTYAYSGTGGQVTITSSGGAANIAVKFDYE